MYSLVNLFNNKFTFLKDTGRYKMPSVKEENILALQAELKIFRNKYKQITKSKGGYKSQKTATTKKTVDCEDKQANKIPKILSGWQRNPHRIISASPSPGATRNGTSAYQRPAESVKGAGAYTNHQNLR